MIPDVLRPILAVFLTKHAETVFVKDGSGSKAKRSQPGFPRESLQLVSAKIIREM